jgi:glutaconate CoA-transferase, subunit A
MARILPLAEAVAELVHDGDRVACEGFTHLIPFAAGHEIIRQGKKNLTLIRMTPDLIYDQMIGMGVAGRLIFSWGGNPGVGSLHRLRDAVERGWPAPIEVEEFSHAGMVQAYSAGASGLPFGVLRGFTGTDLPKVNEKVKAITCPFTGELLAAVPAIRPDVAVIHAQKADRKGNVLIWGIVGVQKEVVLAAKRSIVTVEEIVQRLDPPPNACILPGWLVSAVCLCSGGAYPSYALGYYERDNLFYQLWDGVSRSRDVFKDWMEKNVMGQSAAAEFRSRLRNSIEEAA